MAESGVVTEVQVDIQGSELSTAATVGNATLYVENAEEYDTAGGVIELNDAQFAYTTADLDTSSLTLVNPCPIAGEIGDRVSVVSGGKVARDYQLLVSISDGEAITVPIPYGDRSLWTPGPQNPPIPVTVSDDHSLVLDAPNREPAIDGAYVQTPFLIAALLTAETISSGLTYQTVLGWTVLYSAGGPSGDISIAFDSSTGRFTVPRDGRYSISDTAVLWEDQSSSGRRAIRPYFNATTPGGVNIQDASTRRITTALVTPPKDLMAGDTIEVQVSQNSGGTVDLVGESTGASSFVSIEWRGR